MNVYRKLSVLRSSSSFSSPHFYSKHERLERFERFAFGTISQFSSQSRQRCNSARQFKLNFQQRQPRNVVGASCSHKSWRHYDSNHLQQKRLFSTDNNNQENDSNKINTTSNNKSNNPKIIFPWRESALTPLPRITTHIKDDFSGFNSTSNSKFASKLACSFELKSFTLWSFFISKQWEDELANNASWAFQMALEGLVARTFCVPLDFIDNTLEDGVTVDINTSQSKSLNKSVDKDIEKDIDEEGKENDSSKDDDTNKDKEDEIEDSTQFIQDMVEEKLLSLYKPLTTMNNANNYEITFCLKPIKSKLQNIFIIPSLTRKDVTQNPSLQGAYMAIDNAYKKNQSFDDIKEMSQELVRKTSHKGSKRSIIMDVSIDCAEIFQIRDLDSGEVIQGQGRRRDDNGDDTDDADSTDDTIDNGHGHELEPEMTTHLVRFEMVTSRGAKKGEREIGSWYIIDIDDMLNGNTWH